MANHFTRSKGSGIPDICNTPINTQETTRWTDCTTDCDRGTAGADAVPHAICPTPRRCMYIYTRRRTTSHDHVLVHLPDIDTNTSRNIQCTDAKPDARRNSLKSAIQCAYTCRRQTWESGRGSFHSRKHGWEGPMGHEVRR